MTPASSRHQAKRTCVRHTLGQLHVACGLWHGTCVPMYKELHLVGRTYLAQVRAQEKHVPSLITVMVVIITNYLRLRAEKYLVVYSPDV